jgi:hypothetical protein
MIGAWKMLSFEVISVGTSGAQTTTQRLGPTPLGRMIFNPDGYMSALGTVPEHTKHITPEVPWVIAPDEDVAFVARYAMMYWGAFRIFKEDGGVRLATDVHVSLDPGWMGTEQVRSVELKEKDGKIIMVLRPVQPLLKPVSK